MPPIKPATPATQHPWSQHQAIPGSLDPPLTQLALAHSIGLMGRNAGAYICRLEKGEQEPRIETVRRIAHKLGVPLEKLLEN